MARPITPLSPVTTIFLFCMPAMCRGEAGLRYILQSHAAKTYAAFISINISETDNRFPWCHVLLFNCVGSFCGNELGQPGIWHKVHD